MASQPSLIPGYFRCDRCGGDAERVTRYRRFRFCPACVEEIVPSAAPARGGDGVIRTEEERDENRRFWDWYWDVGHDLRPTKYHPPGRGAVEPVRSSDAFYPLCDCGRPRAVNEIGRAHGGGGGLFGGPFNRECPYCEARGQVERAVAFTARIHPEWDDEDWLDHLYRVFPEAFRVGVLPDYWYELRRGVVKQ